MMQLRAEFEEDLKHQGRRKVSLSTKLLALLQAIERSEEFRLTKLKRQVSERSFSISNAQQVIQQINPLILLRNKGQESDQRDQDLEQQESGSQLDRGTQSGEELPTENETVLPTKTYMVDPESSKKQPPKPSPALQKNFPDLDSLMKDLSHKMKQ
jgi:hypothetical protein